MLTVQSIPVMVTHAFSLVDHFIRACTPDLLATTFGGDTVLHMAARFDHEQILFDVVMAVFSDSPKLLSNLCKESHYVGKSQVSPLADLVTVLQECELQVQRRLLQDIREVEQDNAVFRSAASPIIPEGFVAALY